VSQIISASRRTDLPALHARWLMARLRAGHVDAVNPMNAHQIQRVSLTPADLDALVLWTRHPRPLRPYFGEIADRCGPPLWLVSITGYPRALEPRTPAVAPVVDELQALASRFGAATLHWRYDPIVLSSLTPASFHEERFATLAASLEGAVEACHISFVDRDYRKTARRFAALARSGVRLDDPDLATRRALAARLAASGEANGIRVTSCCEHDLDPAIDGASGDLFSPTIATAVRAGACIDLAWVRRATGRQTIAASPRPTRSHCRCCASKDIGAYDTCSMGCVYCYATRSDAAGRAGRRAVDAEAEALGPRSRSHTRL